jgi:hypothetical protein
MLEEAVRIISRNMQDPFLALLISRIFETRYADTTESGGYLLGPQSRRILREDMLPGLLEATQAKGAEGAVFGLWGLEATMMAVCAGMWLQDKRAVHEVLDVAIAFGIFHANVNSPLVESVKNGISVVGAVDWLVSLPFCTAHHREGIAHSLQVHLSTNGLDDYLSLGLNVLSSEARSYEDCAFMMACTSALSEYRSHQEKIRDDESAKLQREAKDIVVSIEDMEREAVIKRIQGLAGTNDNGAPVVSAPSKGFNFASSFKSTIGAPTGALQHVTSPPIISTSDSSFDPLGGYDVPTVTKPVSSDPLGDYDIPPAVLKPVEAPTNEDPFSQYEIQFDF